MKILGRLLFLCGIGATLAGFIFTQRLEIGSAATIREGGIALMVWGIGLSYFFGGDELTTIDDDDTDENEDEATAA